MIPIEVRRMTVTTCGPAFCSHTETSTGASMNKPMQRGIATANRWGIPKTIEIRIRRISLALLLRRRCREQYLGTSPVELGDDEAWPLAGVKCHRGARTTRKNASQNGRAESEEIEKLSGQKAGKAETNYATSAAATRAAMDLPATRQVDGRFREPQGTQLARRRHTRSRFRPANGGAITGTRSLKNAILMSR